MSPGREEEVGGPLPAHRRRVRRTSHLRRGRRTATAVLLISLLWTRRPVAGARHRSRCWYNRAVVQGVAGRRMWRIVSCPPGRRRRAAAGEPSPSAPVASPGRSRVEGPSLVAGRLRVSRPCWAALSSASEAVWSPYIALPSSVLRSSSIRGNFGFGDVLRRRTHGVGEALEDRLRLDQVGRLQQRVERREQRAALGLVGPRRRCCSGWERYSIHSHAASGSWCSSKHDQRVTGDRGLAARRALGQRRGRPLAVDLRELVGASPANQAPAMYMPTWPLAKATRPS